MNIGGIFVVMLVAAAEATVAYEADHLTTDDVIDEDLKEALRYGNIPPIDMRLKQF